MEQANFPKNSTDEFQYLDESEEALGLETKTHENGHQVKRVKLSNGSVAIIRELNGKDVEFTSRLHNNEKEKVIMSMTAVATKIDGQDIVIEDLEVMKAKDYNKLRMACALLNF